MLDNLKLNTWEVVSFLCTVALMPILLTLPQYAAKTFKSGALVHAIYVAIVVYIVFSLILKLIHSLGSKDIFDTSKYVGGKWLFYIIGILFFLYLLVLNIVTFEEFGEDIKNVLFKKTPFEYINLLFCIGIFIGAFYGPRSLFRSSIIIFPIITLGLILILIFIRDKIDLTNITPILGVKPKVLFWDGLQSIGRYESLCVLLFIPQNVKNIKKTGKIVMISMSALIILSLFMLFTVISYPTILEIYFPLFELTRLISIGRFFQRVESIFTLLWILTTLIYFSGSTFLCTMIIKKIFNIKYPRRILPILIIITLTFSLFIKDYSTALQIRSFMYIYVTPILIIIIPLIILLLAKLKSSGGRKC